MAGGTEASPEKRFSMKRLNAWRKRHAEWYNSLDSWKRILASVVISLAIGAGIAVGGLIGTGIVGIGLLAKIYTANAFQVKMDDYAREMAESNGGGAFKVNAMRTIFAVGSTLLFVLGGRVAATYLMEHGLDFSFDTHGLLGDVAGTSEVIPLTQAQITAYEKLGYHIHKVGDTFVADKNGFRFIWNGKDFGTKGFPIPQAEVAAAGVAGAGNGFNAENVTWLKSVGLNGSQIDALRAYGISDAKIDEWQAEGRVPHINLVTAELTSTKDGVTTVWDPKTQDWKPQLQAPAAAPEAAAETATTKVCTGLATVVESKGAHGCDGSEALLMDLARRLVAAGATADTYEQGTVLDRLVEAQLNGNVARMASVLSQELGMLNPNDHLDSANIWDNARLRVEGTRLTLVGPGTGPNGDLLVDCTKIDGFDGKMIHTTACGEAPATPAPAPETPVVTAEVAPEPEVVPPPPEVVPAPTPVPPPEVVVADTCPPPKWVLQTGVGIFTEHHGHANMIFGVEIEGMTKEQAEEYLRKVVAEGAIPPNYQPGLSHRVIWVALENCDGSGKEFLCFDIDSGQFQSGPLSVSDELGHRTIVRSVEDFHDLLNGTHDTSASVIVPKEPISLKMVDADGDSIPDRFVFDSIPKAEIVERQFALIWDDVFEGTQTAEILNTINNTPMSEEFVAAIARHNINAAAHILETQFHMTHEQAITLARWVDMFNSGTHIPAHTDLTSNGVPKTFGQFFSESVSNNADKGVYPEMRTSDIGTPAPVVDATPRPVASPYAAEAAPGPVDANTALVRLGESFDAIPAIDAKIQLIGQYDIQSIMNLDANQIPGLSADQKEAWAAVRRVLLEGRNSGVVRGGHMSLSAFMQQVMGVTATNTD